MIETISLSLPTSFLFFFPGLITAELEAIADSFLSSTGPQPWKNKNTTLKIYSSLPLKFYCIGVKVSF